MQGLEGGKRTATLLKKLVEDELRSSDGARHLQVIIRVYSNLKGLSKTYKEMGLLSDGVFEDFVRGFNMGDVMCDYIDAGNGKECSDEKVKGQSACVIYLAQHDDANAAKGISGSISPMYIVSGYILGAPPTMATLVYLNP